MYLPDSRNCILKIKLFAPDPKGSNLFFLIPFRDEANEEHLSHQQRE